MDTQNSSVDKQQIDPKALPAPHCCPMWVQYLLVSPIRRLLEPADKLIGPYTESGMTVLDLGCGFGYVSLPLAQKVGESGHVICVDVEPRAVKRLKKRAQKAGLAERITTHICTSHNLDLDKYVGEIDLVTVVHTMHEFDDLPEFLQQIKTLLKPSGRLLVIEPPGHVKHDHFAAEIALCCRMGFRKLDLPADAKHKQTALLAPA